MTETKPNPLGNHTSAFMMRLDRRTPAEDAQTVDHGGVRVGAHQAVRVEEPVVVEHHPGQVLQVDLVNDPRSRRDDPHVPEGFGAPLGKNREDVEELKEGKDTRINFVKKKKKKVFNTFKN